MIEGHSETEDLGNEQRQHLRKLIDDALSDQTKDRGEILAALIQDHTQLSTQLRAEFDKIELIRNTRHLARDADPAAPTSRRDDTQSQALPSDADLRATRQFGRYRVLRLLGSGGFGTVYHGFDEELERFVAIKVPRSDRLTDEAFVKDILREAKLAAQLRHSAIVSVFDVGRDERGVPFIVQDFIDGQSLTLEPRFVAAYATVVDWQRGGGPWIGRRQLLDARQRACARADGSPTAHTRIDASQYGV